MPIKLVSGDVIAYQAEQALTEPGFVTEPGNCQKWVREVIQSLYGHAFDQYWASSAYLTMLKFQDSTYMLSATTLLQRGDILYKGKITSGRFGHVGIVIPHGRVAENSSCHWDESGAQPDARGTRTLAAFGEYEGVVRLRGNVETEIGG